MATPETVRKAAELARLKLTEAEVATFTPQLGEILGYVDLLKEVDVSGVEPLTHPHFSETPLRDDAASASAERFPGSVLDSAPDSVDEGFKVPQIL